MAEGVITGEFGAKRQKGGVGVVENLGEGDLRGGDGPKLEREEVAEIR